jgi:hypothetical protein
LFNKKHEGSRPPTTPPPLSDTAREALHAFRAIEKRALAARATDVLQVVEQARNLNSGDQPDTYHDALRSGFTAVNAGATEEELDAIARALAQGVLPHVRQVVSVAAPPELTASELAEVEQIFKRAKARQGRTAEVDGNHSA